MPNKYTDHRLRGLTVNIYQNPLTREKFEGAARVIKVICCDEQSRLIRCRVKFKQNGQIGERLIFAPGKSDRQNPSR